MKTNLKQAKILRETAAKLIKQAELLEAGINPNQCDHGEYTNIPFKGCKSCGNTVRVICSHKEINPKIRNSGGCNPQNCKYFESPGLSAASLEKENYKNNHSVKKNGGKI